MEKDNDRRGRWFWRGALILFAALPMISADEIPGWIKAGSHPGDYDMGVDRAVMLGNHPSGFIKSNKPDSQGFGTYMQMFDAGDYRGKRVRFSALVRTENVENGSALWMRVDGESRSGIAFDNMQKRQIKGTQNWARYSVVLDVDPKARAIAFGVMLHGKGAVWINEVGFATVGQDVAVTDMVPEMKLQPGPRNVGFDQK